MSIQAGTGALDLLIPARMLFWLALLISRLAEPVGSRKERRGRITDQRTRQDMMFWINTPWS